MNKVFLIKEPIYEYDLRNTFDFATCCINTVRYGLKSLSYFGPRLWNILPDEYKKLRSVKDFKAKIRSWVHENCTWRLCKIYIQHIDIIQGSLPVISNSLSCEVGWGQGGSVDIN